MNPIQIVLTSPGEFGNRQWPATRLQHAAGKTELVDAKPRRIVPALEPGFQQISSAPVGYFTVCFEPAAYISHALSLSASVCVFWRRGNELRSDSRKGMRQRS
jgi:hypothetical protein